MKLLLVWPLFLYFLVTGAKSVHATTCSPACTDNNICDKVQEKCSIKAGKSCLTSEENKCVSGANCDNDLCKCGDGYTEESDICKPKTPGTVGTTCTSGSTECTTPNSICSNFLACKCKPEYLLNVVNGQCDGKLEAACKEGDTCVASLVCDKVDEKCLIKHDQPCTDNPTKCVSNAACSQGVCKCDASKAVSASTGLCLLKTSQSCTVENCVVGAICKDSTCQCDVAKSVSSNTGLCLLKAGQPCEEDICVYGATCQSTRCQCSDRHVENSITKLCDAKPGSTCSEDVACVASSACESGTCHAKPGSTCSVDVPCVGSSVCKSGTCLIKHEQSCADYNNKCVPHATCDENVCKCDATKAVPSSTGVCLLRAGQSCDEDICISGATCKSSSCQCNDDYSENSNTKLCEANPGTACSEDVTCVSSSVCESETCLIKHGQSCSYNTDKCVSNAVCVNNVCQCDANSVDLPSGLCTLKSESSASGTHFFWLLLVALMALTLTE